jgi:hypothetical protein
VAVSLLLGCASVSFQDGIYDNGTVRYRVGMLGSDWQRVEVDDNDLAFHHAQLGVIAVNSTCTDYEDVPEVALVNHLLFGTSERDFRVEETITLDGRGARHVIVDVELDGVPLTLDIFLLKKDGCVYDITFTASRTSHPQGQPLFNAFVQRFAVLATNLDD